LRILIALAAVAITTLAGDSDRASAMVTVIGGPHAGNFVVRNADVPCEILEQKAPLPKHHFSVSIGGLTPSKDPNKLTLLMVIIPNADVRGPNQTFFTSIIFGDVSRGMEYAAETRPGEKLAGSGTVTVAPHGNDATVTFDVKSRDNVSYKGTIQCSGVSRY
jgi:hypothetical protein